MQLNLTSRSGRAAVKHRMEEMGYKDTDYNMDHLYDAFLKLADKKGQVFDYDLEALAFINKQQEEPEHFRLDYFSVQSGSSDIATASVKLACGDETKLRPPTVTARWTPFYQAINRITGYEIELVNMMTSTPRVRVRMRWARWTSWRTTTAAASTAWVWRRISWNLPRKPWFTS
ncbi:2-isopropylmalate synthase [Klebsiella michiganensis]|uniref:2-isopropylmalate synthase n=1 Tax=Klebsiella michiganensis TaxID=1134687 RepID=A0A7H4N7Q0_9ENTR|nr:2-isopropylmalate synthase [Klebsiella michiganensis]